MKNKWMSKEVQRLLPEDYSCLQCGVAKIFAVYKKTPPEQDWRDVGIVGIAAVIVSHHTYATYLRLYEFDNPVSTVLFECQLPSQCNYQLLTPVFHSFETENLLFGLLFSSEKHSTRFFKYISHSLSQIHKHSQSFSISQTQNSEDSMKESVKVRRRSGIFSFFSSRESASSLEPQSVDASVHTLQRISTSSPPSSGTISSTNATIPTGHAPPISKKAGGKAPPPFVPPSVPPSSKRLTQPVSAKEKVIPPPFVPKNVAPPPLPKSTAPPSLPTSTAPPPLSKSTVPPPLSKPTVPPPLSKPTVPPPLPTSTAPPPLPTIAEKKSGVEKKGSVPPNPPPSVPPPLQTNKHPPPPSSAIPQNTKKPVPPPPSINVAPLAPEKKVPATTAPRDLLREIETFNKTKLKHVEKEGEESQNGSASTNDMLRRRMRVFQESTSSESDSIEFSD